MKIQLLSDLHLEMLLDRHQARIEPTAADVVVLAGDIGDAEWVVDWAAEQAELLQKPVLFVPGNHEYYYNSMGRAVDCMRRDSLGTGVHFLDMDQVVIDGVRFLGATLWTDYRGVGDAELAMETAARCMNDHRLIILQDRTFTPEDALARHRASLAWLRQQLEQPFEGQTVVVTHHGPSPQCQPPQFPRGPIAAAFWSDLEALMGPPIDLWLYGHTHHNIDRCINGTRLVSNCCGYRHHVWEQPEVEDYDPKFVIDV